MWHILQNSSKLPTFDLDLDIWKKFPIASKFLIFLSVVVIIIGSTGNLLVIWIVCRSKTMWTATNILIANLAIADVLVLVFDMPLTLHYQLFKIWIYGIYLCHAFSMLFGVFVCVSILSLTAIAIDRYVLIVRPLSPKLTPSKAIILAVCIFFISTLIALPVGIFAKVTDLSVVELGIVMSACGEDWSYPLYRTLYTVTTILILFIFPLIIIACLYMLIFRKIRQRIKSRSGSSSRTNRMLVSVVLVFVITWVPHQLVTSVIEFLSFLDYDPDTLIIIDMYFRLLALSSSCINPILYGYMNDNFHNGFIRAFACILPKSTKLRLRPTRAMTNHGEKSSMGGMAAGSVKNLPSPPQQQKSFAKIKNQLLMKRLKEIELKKSAKDDENTNNRWRNNADQVNKTRDKIINQSIKEGTSDIYLHVEVDGSGQTSNQESTCNYSIEQNNDAELLLGKKANWNETLHAEIVHNLNPMSDKAQENSEDAKSHTTTFDN